MRLARSLSRIARLPDRLHHRYHQGRSSTALREHFCAYAERQLHLFSHVGGTIPYLATRFSIVDAMRVIPGAEERGDALRRLYWDTACPGTPLIYRCFGPWLA